MSAKKRIETLAALTSSHRTLINSPKLAQILGELNRIVQAERAPTTYAWILKVLHTTRALDTSLAEVLAHQGWSIGDDNPSLGVYLKTFEKKRVLTPTQRLAFRQAVADKRNLYMHQAGAMPSPTEADKILSEMDACLALILGAL